MCGNILCIIITESDFSSFNIGQVVTLNATLDTVCGVVEALTDDRVESVEAFALLLNTSDSAVQLLSDNLTTTISDESLGIDTETIYYLVQS